ncbi:diguanylate cyclase domain-containing protein [Neptuniibacter sp. QD72_48]|uniref:GGDEF domain-containing response regulator n=1 Tax=Neptuniibacter sp. QD72_48 TaxID=3398214 RepID=UPI0039F578A9
MDNVKGHVLVVDDEAVNCNVLVSLLDDYKVIVAKSGVKAISRARENPPDIILLDVVMPEMNGYEVCSILKADETTCHIPIIFITVKSTIEEETQGLQLGAVDYISKPFSPAIVQARVHNHIQLKKQRDMLEALNVTDSLTGIANRRHFDLAMNQYWQAACRTSSPVALLMIDIDHFKQYNDHYGHQLGDECLALVAQTLDRQCDRDLDQACRYGGEEFAVILPYTDKSGAVKVAERILRAIRALKIPHKGSDTAQMVTVSIGLSVKEAVPSLELESLIARADQALYAAKNGGRNCCHHLDAPELTVHHREASV